MTKKTILMLAAVAAFVLVAGVALLTWGPFAGSSDTAAATAAASPAAKAKKGKGDAANLAEGTLVSAANGSVTVHTKQGDQTYPVDASATVRLDGATVQLNQLQPGMRVHLSAQRAKTGKSTTADAGDGHTVERISAKSAESPAAQASS